MQLFSCLEVPDDDRCVCASGNEDGRVVEGGGEEAFDEVCVTLQGFGSCFLCGEINGVDILVPGSREELVCDA